MNDPLGATMEETPAPEAPITFAGKTLGKYRHVCAFFDGPVEEYPILLPFIKEGIERGDRAFHIIDPKLRADHLQRLQAVGIDVERAIRTGQLDVRNWDEAYLRGGHFNRDAMLALIAEVLEAGPRRSFPLTRLVAHMEWALEDRPGVNDLVEYETRLNYLLPRYPDPVI